MRIILSIILFCLSTAARGEEAENFPRRFAYEEKDHSTKEVATHLSVVYGATLVAYPLFQPPVLFGEKGSWQEYRKNFGRLVYDHDEPFWNWMVHPLSGSQLYLFYRSLGYKQKSSFFMTSISSALFEFTVEVYSEPASIQDLYQTPAIGSTLGYSLEALSIQFLNSGSSIGEAFGRIINPYSYISDSAPLTMTPYINKGHFGVQLVGVLP